MPYKLKILKKKGKWKTVKLGFASFNSAYNYAQNKYGKNNKYYPSHYSKRKQFYTKYKKVRRKK